MILFYSFLHNYTNIRRKGTKKITHTQEKTWKFQKTHKNLHNQKKSCNFAGQIYWINAHRNETG